MTISEESMRDDYLLDFQICYNTGLMFFLYQI